MEPQMTSPTSAASSRKRSANAFTLTELLVVMGIIALLAGIILPMVVRAYGKGRAARAGLDLQAISVALDAYKADFGDYPRVGANQTGAATLGLALVGPYGDGVLPPPGGGVDASDPPTVVAGTGYKPGEIVRQTAAVTSPQYVCLALSKGSDIADATKWAMLPPAFANDGYDGPGFRPRAGGRVRQPYLSEGKIQMRGLDLLDLNGNPVLYFPASPARPNPAIANGYVAQENRSANPPVVPRYNVLNNSAAFDPTATFAQSKIRAMLGDTNLNGQLDPGESAVDNPYLLWTSGADNVFGPATYDFAAITGTPTAAQLIEIRTAVSNCDDVTNFK